MRWTTTELEEGQQIVGVVIDVLKTGQGASLSRVPLSTVDTVPSVPPGQVSQDTLYFWHSYRNQSAMTGNGTSVLVVLPLNADSACTTFKLHGWSRVLDNSIDRSTDITQNVCSSRQTKSGRTSSRFSQT